MSNLPGNPHYESSYGTLVRIEGKTMTFPESENTLRGAQVTATLALAYEQRTANMLLAFQAGVYDAREWPHVVKSQIAARMGITEVSEGATE